MSITILLLYFALFSLDSQSIQDECYWQSCKTISETDTFYAPLENRIFLHQDTIFNQQVLIKQGLKGNRILERSVRHTDTFIVKNDSVLWRNASHTGLLFNEASFARGDTIYFLRTRTGFPPEPIRLIPIEKVMRNGWVLYKYASSISNKATKLDYIDPKTIFEGEYTVGDGQYCFHPILGVVERDNTYHLPGHQVNHFYSSNDKACSLVIKSLEEKLGIR